MPFPFDKYPWLNFQELNLAYFIKHFREIFEQWDTLLHEMYDWKDATDAELAEWKTTVETGISSWESGLQQSMEDWKDETEADISAWEAATLSALDAWKTATTAVFEQIRTEAAASAQAAAGSASSAQTALDGAQAAQAAAEAAAAGIQSELTQIQTNTADISELKTQLNADESIVFPSLNGGKSIVITEGTEPGYYSNGTRVVNARFSCIEFVVPHNAKKISYTYTTESSAQAGAILSANRTVLQPMSGTAEAHEYAIPENAYYIDLNFFDGTYVTDYEIEVETFANKSDVETLASNVSNISDDVLGIDTELNGSVIDIPFVQTGNGYINASNTLSYTDGATGDNQVMVVNDLSSAGLAIGDHLTIKAGYLANTGGVVGFATSAITQTAALFSIVPWTSTDAVQTVEFTIPSRTVAIAFFNRKSNNANPQITAVENEGLITEVNNNAARLDEIDDNLIDVNNKTLFAKNIIAKPLTFTGKTIAVFGDSIAYGYASNPLAPISDCWVNLFAAKTGATIVNQAVAGSTLATRSGHTDSILEKITAYSGTSPDIIIVAGGTNDYGNNVPVGDYDDSVTTSVYGAMNNIVSAISTDFAGIPVIFITPINRTTADDKEKLTYFNSIRNAVFEIAAKSNHMVINGADLGFPLTDGDYKEDVLYDGTHPTAAGHKMYCDAVCGILM